MTFSICGIGTAVPQRSIAQSDAAQIAQSFIYGASQDLSLLYRGTAIQQRGSVLLEHPNGDRYRQSFYPPATAADDRGPATAERMQRYSQEATPLAVEASDQALQEASVQAADITHLVTVSCTGFHAPGVEFNLIKQLGLSPSVTRLNVGFMGCHGALNGLGAAKAFGEANPGSRVLMCSVELCSLHYHYGDEKQKLVSNALFADGAGALVGVPASNDVDDWQVAACGSCLMPDSDDEMTWRVGNHGFEMTLSAEVPALIREHLRPYLAQWLKSHGWTIDQIGSWAIHPGGPKIVQSAVQALDLPWSVTDTSFEVLADHGNMSSATILFVLQKLRQQDAPLPCVAIGFGPGLVAEVALLV